MSDPVVPYCQSQCPERSALPYCASVSHCETKAPLAEAGGRVRGGDGGESSSD